VAAQAARAGAQRVQAAPAVQGRSLQIEVADARSATEQYLAAAGVAGTVHVSPTTITVTVTDTYRPRFLSLAGVGPLQVTGSATAHLIRSVGGTAR
jgi:hypothetical protein